VAESKRRTTSTLKPLKSQQGPRRAMKLEPVVGRCQSKPTSRE